MEVATARLVTMDVRDDEVREVRSVRTDERSRARSETREDLRGEAAAVQEEREEMSARLRSEPGVAKAAEGTSTGPSRRSQRGEPSAKPDPPLSLWYSFAAGALLHLLYAAITGHGLRFFNPPPVDTLEAAKHAALRAANPGAAALGTALGCATSGGAVGALFGWMSRQVAAVWFWLRVAIVGLILFGLITGLMTPSDEQRVKADDEPAATPEKPHVSDPPHVPAQPPPTPIYVPNTGDGTLFINTLPKSYCVVNGTARGMVPITLKLPAGTYDVTCAIDDDEGLLRKSGSVTLKAGQKSTFVLKLRD